VSYDPGSDAAVRVRANDVRKRLGSYYEQNQSRTGFRIELPPGSYVPQFVKAAAALSVAVSSEPTPIPTEAPPAIPFLELRHLAAPTILALFVCAISIRYQLLGTAPFHMFWSGLLKGKSHLTVVVERSGNLDNSANLDQVQASVPLLNLAQAFQVQPVIRNSLEAGIAEHDTVLIRLSNQFSPQLEANPHIRFVIRMGQSGLQIVDKQAPTHRWTHAALITVLPDDATPAISLGATDLEALHSGTRLLTDRSAFPQVLLNSLRTAETTQALFDEQGGTIQVRED
jgi:hypothetical protein